MSHDSTDDTDNTHRWSNIDRRHLLAGVGGTLATGLAGCNKQQTIEEDASPVRLDASVDEQGYALLEKANTSLNRTVDIPGITLDVTLRNHFASYQHGSGLTVGLASTPAAEQAGQSLNPIATAPLGELLKRDLGKRFVGQLGVDASWRRGPERVGDQHATLLDDSVDAKTFAGVTDDGEFVLLNVARTETDEIDDVVLVGTAWTEPAVGDQLLVGEDGHVPRKIVDRSAEEFDFLSSAVVHGEEPGDPGTPDYPSEVPQILADPDEDALWKDLSRQLAETRQNGDPTALNGDLAEAASTVDGEGLAATFAFWVAENFRMAERHEEAIARYSAVLDDYGTPDFRGLDVAASVLRKRARSEQQLGRIDDALATYDELIAREGGNAARAYYLKGLAAEESGREDVAAAAYRDAADAEEGFPNNPWSVRELGQRGAIRLSNSFNEYYDDPDELLGRLAAALLEDAYEELQSLASPTHFTVGPQGGCCDYVHTEAVIEDLLVDARGSELGVDTEAVERTGGSAYLPTEGWTGEHFAGVVSLQISESPQGWAFTGITLHTSDELVEASRQADLEAGQVVENFLLGLNNDWQPPADADEVPVYTNSPTPSPTPTPGPTKGKVATMDITSPWSTGEHCTAGGIIDWGATKLAPGAGACFNGPAGFYYKTGPTHSDFEDKHAIDFTQYRQRTTKDKLSPKPYVNTAFGTPVLATNYGKVEHTYFGTKNGKKGIANKVVLEHPSGKLPGSGVYTDFRSRYLHLNRNIIRAVSDGSFVNQGDKLSEMDDTGNSAHHHLHFNVRKVYNDESVQPTPMDGQRLEQRHLDNGRCVTSR